MGKTMVPNSPEVVAWAEKVAGLVEYVETQMIEAIRDSVYADLGANYYQVDQLARIATVRARLEKILGRDWQKVISEAQRVLDQARNAGQGLANRDLANAGLPEFLPASQAFAIEVIALDTFTALSGMPAVILRNAQDAYQSIMAGPVTSVTTGAFTRVEATQQALLDWAYSGVGGFVDKSGRQWSMDAYAEMAVRTGGMNAMREGHAATLRAAGQDLVQVTGHGYTCPKCAKYQGKILSLGQTPPGVLLVEHAIRDNVFVEVDVAATVEQATEEGLFHPNCFVPETLVQTVGAIDVSDSRWYEGQVVVVETARGNEITVTPNHPILTPEGWVAAGLLTEGMQVFNHVDWAQASSGDGPDQVDVPTRISDVHSSLKESGAMRTVCVPTTALDFHGDGTVNGEVEVVLRHSLLKDHGMPSLPNEGGQSALLSGRVGLGSLLPECALGEVCVCTCHAAHRVVSSGNASLTIRDCLVLPRSARRLGSIGAVATLQEDGRHSGLSVSEPLSDSALGELTFEPEPFGVIVPRSVMSSEAQSFEPGIDSGPVDTVPVCEGTDGLSGKVTVTEIVKVDRRDYSGHVHNLQTEKRWYLADSIVVHNCAHSNVGYFPGLTTPFTGPPNIETYEKSQVQRALEVEVRKVKRQMAAAFTEDAMADLRKKKYDLQKKIRELVDETPMLVRKPLREQIKTAH